MSPDFHDVSTPSASDSELPACHHSAQGWGAHTHGRTLCGGTSSAPTASPQVDFEDKRNSWTSLHQAKINAKHPHGEEQLKCREHLQKLELRTPGTHMAAAQQRAGQHPPWTGLQTPSHPPGGQACEGQRGAGGGWGHSVRTPRGAVPGSQWAPGALAEF